MRLRILRGGPAGRFRFDQRDAAGAHHSGAAPLSPASLRRAALDNPYGRYYSRPRSLEELLDARREARSPNASQGSSSSRKT